MENEHGSARIWFFTDIHGSNACFRKFLRLVSNPNRPNVLILGGDITGKLLVPLVRDQLGHFTAYFHGDVNQYPIEKLSTISKALSDFGIYPYVCDEQEYLQFKYDEALQKNVFETLIAERMEEWVELADSVLPSQRECTVIVNAGNDDPLFVDGILDRSTKIIRPEGRVLDLPCGLKLLSTGYSNITPWKCPRDVSESDLKARIAAMTSTLKSEDRDRLIFSFHCPPINSSLDIVDAIHPETFEPKVALSGKQKAHVGSSAVREAIENWQPLISFHGHIHEIYSEEKIGNTLSFNPGSDYRNGCLQGAFVKIDQGGEIELATLTRERQWKQTKSLKPTLLDRFSKAFPLLGILFDSDNDASRESDSEALEDIRRKVSSILEAQESQEHSIVQDTKLNGD